MSYQLNVWLFDSHVGLLFLDKGRLHFSYTKHWLEKPDAYPISASLPLQQAPFNDYQTRPFFAGLLPEGAMRKILAQQFNLSQQNEFALLALLAGECAGAIRLLPLDFPHSDHTENLKSNKNSQQIKWLNDAQLESILTEIPLHPMLAGNNELRLSLAGAQDKLPLVYENGRFGLPLWGTPSTHIMKPAIPHFDQSVLNEHFSLRLAQSMGLKAANSKAMQVGTKQFLLVERYDRKKLDNQWLRIHQEDFCQALGVVSELKYQNEGGPSLSDCFLLLNQLARPSAPETLKLFDAVVFNALIGNHDAHGKNFSLLYKNKGSPSLAPLYDLLCTAVYPTLTPKMAMKIGSKYKFSEIFEHHWLNFAEQIGFNPTLAKKRIIQIATQLPLRAAALQQETIFSAKPTGQATIQKIVALIEQRCALTVRRLK